MVLLSTSRDMHMLRISKLTDYAIVLLSLMAKSQEKTFAAAELAERSGIAVPTVSKILKGLAKAGIVKSTRGVKGGYHLCHAPQQTTVASVIDALEGPIAITECGVTKDSCQQGNSCHIRGNWMVINRAVRTALEAVTLVDMVPSETASPEETLIPVKSISLTSR